MVQSNKLKFLPSYKLYQDDKESKTAASLSNNIEYGQLNITINHSMKCQLHTSSSIHFTIINYCSRICCECSCINIPDFVKEKQDLSCHFFSKINRSLTIVKERCFSGTHKKPSSCTKHLLLQSVLPVS